MDDSTIPKWAVALVGVIAGFVLKELSDFLKEKLRARKYRIALDDELNTNLHQLSQKIDIANQMKTALSNDRFLGGLSVPFASSVYDHYFPYILKDMKSLQKDNVRHIYSTLKVIDGFMFDIEESFKNDSKGEAMADIKAAYIGKIDDVLQTYKIIQGLIIKYLAGTPVDIYYRETKST